MHKFETEILLSFQGFFSYQDCLSKWPTVWYELVRVHASFSKNIDTEIFLDAFCKLLLEMVRSNRKILHSLTLTESFCLDFKRDAGICTHMSYSTVNQREMCGEHSSTNKYDTQELSETVRHTNDFSFRSDQKSTVFIKIPPRRQRYTCSPFVFSPP